MKEIIAADMVGDSRRVHQIVKRVSGNKGTPPASLASKDAIVWVEHFVRHRHRPGDGHIGQPEAN